jgi:predicted lysophospholipase L1 biosynthesis ABC-type transport system permease subunit
MTAGRDFTWRDRDASQPVAIISEALARRMWPGQNAIGKLIAVDGPRQPLREVVGVAHDAKYRSIVTAPPLLLYEPVMQKYDSYVTIEVRTRSAPAAFAPVLQRELAALDPNVALYNVRTFASQVDRSLWQQRSAAALIAAFSLIALVLAAVGLFSQLAHSVSSRTREIGIRMALGADARAVQRGVMRQGLLLTAIGATAGLLGATALARFAAGLLYGVPARDPLTFALAATVLLIVAIPASYFPARSATRVDPMTALRQD